MPSLAPLYAPRVAYYGRDTPLSGIIGAKAAALGPGSTFHQQIVRPIAIEDHGDTLVATFTKRSGKGNHARDVRASLVVAIEAGPPRIVSESVETTDHARSSAAHRRCEEVTERVVNALPEVQREVAETERAVDAADASDVHFGGIGPLEEDDGSFAGIGVHTSERFEPHVSYGVDAHGHLSVSTWGASDLAIPRAAMQEVERACGGACQVELQGTEVPRIERASFDDVARAAIPSYRPEAGCATVVDASIVDCRGGSASSGGIVEPGATDDNALHEGPPR